MLTLLARSTLGRELRRGSALGLCCFGLLPTRGFISALQKQKDRKKQEKLKQELKSKQEAESVSGRAPFSPPRQPHSLLILGRGAGLSGSLRAVPPRAPTDLGTCRAGAARAAGGTALPAAALLLPFSLCRMPRL